MMPVPAMRIEINQAGRVRATCDVALPLSAAAVWGQMRDFPRFCKMDPLHRRVVMSDRDAEYPPRGAHLVIGHRFLGIGPDRVGRVLTWREGIGFAFSDLSRRGPHVGFPHICSYEVRPHNAQRCILTIGARGRWTSPWVPRWCARWWIAWVLRETAHVIHREMRNLLRWQRAQVRRADG